jgi:hypothetical protein
VTVVVLVVHEPQSTGHDATISIPKVNDGGSKHSCCKSSVQTSGSKLPLQFGLVLVMEVPVVAVVDVAVWVVAVAVVLVVSVAVMVEAVVVMQLSHRTGQAFRKALV